MIIFDYQTKLLALFFEILKLFFITCQKNLIIFSFNFWLLLFTTQEQMHLEQTVSELVPQKWFPQSRQIWKVLTISLRIFKEDLLSLFRRIICVIFKKRHLLISFLATPENTSWTGVLTSVLLETYVFILVWRGNNWILHLYDMSL